MRLICRESLMTIDISEKLIGYECLLCIFDTDRQDLIDEHMRNEHGSIFGEEWENCREIYCD